MEVSSASYIWRILMAVGSMFTYIQSLGKYIAEMYTISTMQEHYIFIGRDSFGSYVEHILKVAERSILYVKTTGEHLIQMIVLFGMQDLNSIASYIDQTLASLPDKETIAVYLKEMMVLSMNPKRSKEYCYSESNMDDSQEEGKFEVITAQAVEANPSTTFTAKPEVLRESVSPDESFLQFSEIHGSQNIPFQIYEDEAEPQAVTDLAKDLEISDDEELAQEEDDSRRTEKSHEAVALRDQVEIQDILQEQYVYLRRKLAITRDILHDFTAMIFVWCPMEMKVRPDFIATVLHKSNMDVNLRSRFSSLPCSNIQTWSGAVAEYATEDSALAAILELTTASRYVKAVKLDWLLDQFIDAELRHPLCGFGSVNIVVRGRTFFPVAEQAYWNWQFRRFGDVHFIDFYPVWKDPSVICEVGYAYASQAQAAQMYLDGLFHGLISKFRVEVADTTKEREILREAENRLNCCFR